MRGSNAEPFLKSLDDEFNTSDALRAGGLSTALAFWNSRVHKVREWCQIFFQIEHSAPILDPPRQF